VSDGVGEPNLVFWDALDPSNVEDYEEEEGEEEGLDMGDASSSDSEGSTITKAQRRKETAQSNKAIAELQADQHQDNMIA
jgi:hypothetical protein